MTTPAEQAQSAERAARRRAERRSTEGIGIDPDPVPGVEHFLAEHEAREGAAMKAAEEARIAEEFEYQKSLRAAEKAAKAPKKNDQADADQKGSK